MNKLNISRGIRSLKVKMVKHSPEILTGLGIAGMLTTTVLAVKATPKALILIENEKQLKTEQMDVDEPTLTPAEIIKTTYICYMPAAITCGVSLLCLVGANSVNARRNAALAMAYTLSESTLKGYQEKVIDTIGEKKERTIRDAIAKDIVENNSVTNKEVIITEKGNSLCYDAVSGRYFKSDIDSIIKASNSLNRDMVDQMYVSLNDFYYEIGLSNTQLGDYLGWNINDGLIDLDFSSQLAANGEPCLVVGYRLAPRYDYQNCH